MLGKINKRLSEAENYLHKQGGLMPIWGKHIIDIELRSKTAGRLAKPIHSIKVFG